MRMERQVGLNPIQPIPLILVTIFGSYIWFLHYCLSRKIFSRQSSEFSSRVIAGLHAIFMVILSFSCINQGPDPLYGGEGQPNTQLQKFTMVCSLSYFVYDLGWCLYYQTEPVIMLLHHLASITALACILSVGQSGAEAIAGLGSMEVTNPLLQARWFLRTAGYNRTRLHTLVEWTFIILFVVMRLLYGSRLTYTIMTSEKVPWQVKTCTGSLFFISIAFMYHMAQFVKKKYIDRHDRRPPQPTNPESENKDD